MLLASVNKKEVFFEIDDEDFDRIKSYRWFANGDNYVQANINNSTRMLHRFILNYKGNLQIDHIDCNPLNNRKVNLRVLSPSNNRARCNPSSNKTGFRNVKTTGLHKKLYWAQMKFKGKQITSKGFREAFNAAVEAQNLYEIYRPEIEVCIPFEKGWVLTLK